SLCALQPPNALNREARRFCPRNTQASLEGLGRVPTGQRCRPTPITCSSGGDRRPETARAPRLFLSGIMRSDLPAKAADDGASTATAPHNPALRITQSVFSPATRPLAARLSAGL